MSVYRTVVVGTDGSDSSLRAVDRAATIAAQSGAKMFIATAYFPQHDDARAADVLRDEGYKTTGAAPIYAILKEAHRAGSGRRRQGRGRTIDRRRPRRRVGGTCRGSRSRPSGGRQRRPEHDHRPAPGIGAGQRVAQGQDRRLDRPHHELTRGQGSRLPAVLFHSSRCGLCAPRVVSSPCPGVRPYRPPERPNTRDVTPVRA